MVDGGHITLGIAKGLLQAALISEEVMQRPKFIAKTGAGIITVNSHVF